MSYFSPRRYTPSGLPLQWDTPWFTNHLELPEGDLAPEQRAALVCSWVRGGVTAARQLAAGPNATAAQALQVDQLRAALEVCGENLEPLRRWCQGRCGDQLHLVTSAGVDEGWADVVLDAHRAMAAMAATGEDAAARLELLWRFTQLVDAFSLVTRLSGEGTESALVAATLSHTLCFETLAPVLDAHASPWTQGAARHWELTRHRLSTAARAGIGPFTGGGRRWVFPQVAEVLGQDLRQVSVAAATRWGNAVWWLSDGTVASPDDELWMLVDAVHQGLDREVVHTFATRQTRLTVGELADLAAAVRR